MPSSPVLGVRCPPARRSLLDRTSSTRSNPIRIVALLLLGPFAGIAWAQTDGPVPEPETADIRRCVEIVDPTERLACFDAVAAGEAPREEASFLERHWDLAGEARPFRPWPHRPNYVLPGRWTDSANEAPFRAAVQDNGRVDAELQSIEAKFQISFKTKIWEEVLGGPGNLWFAYTQQSHFQVYNARESRPFRETDFEPEIVLTFPMRQKWGGWTWRMIGGGLVHQSNGRSEPLSKSWNRIYAIVAGESGNVSLHVRAWTRIDSTAEQDDDNPDIEGWVGRAEGVLTWFPGRQVFLLRGRSNLEVGGHRGSFQGDWYFPISHRMRGLVQVFTGYGESLIDYNHRQTSIGAGFLLFDPF